MKLLTPALLAATALSMTLPAVAQAQNYRDCESSRQNRQVAGALIGGILGAVIGNELADDSNNNRHGRPDRWDRRARWDDHRRHGGGYYGHRDRRYQHRDRGNAEEVGTIAGAGVGALIGAGIAGGTDCGSRHRARGGYHGDKPAGYYGDSGYYDDGRYYDDRYRDSGTGYDPYYRDGYGQDYGSSVELLGGAAPGPSARTYSASSGYATTSAAGQCQWSQTRRMGEYGQTVTEQVYMCQGTDGIWRPADTYNR
jgi:uncharacterized protein YcfJ